MLRTRVALAWSRSTIVSLAIHRARYCAHTHANPAPARAPLFPSSILYKMSLATSGRLFGMRPLLRLGTSIGDTFERNWATCQQLADEGTQNDPMRVETPLN